jgi:hypothetical protein
MPDPRADPRLPCAVGMHRIHVHIAGALFALFEQRIALAACEVLGEVLHGLLLAPRLLRSIASFQPFW